MMNMMRSFVVSAVLLGGLGNGSLYAGEKWLGVDEAVVKKIAREHGRQECASLIPAAEGEERNLVAVQVDLAADQPVRPRRTHRPIPPEQVHRTRRIRSPHIHHSTPWPGLQFQLPVLRKRTTGGSRLNPGRPMLSQGLHMPQRTILKMLQMGVLESCPNASLPPPVVTLDHRLEAHLSRRHEHRHHSQTQAQTDHLSQRIGVSVCALENHGVVELAYLGNPTSRQCAVRDSTVKTAVTADAVGQETTKPPCKDTPLRTSTSGPPLMTKPSTTSKLSNSARAAATSGRYQPRGGAGRRVL